MSQGTSYLLVWAKYRLHGEDQYGDGYQDFIDYHVALSDALQDIKSEQFATLAGTLHVFLRTCLRPIVRTTLSKAPFKNASASQGAAQKAILECAIDIAVHLALKASAPPPFSDTDSQGDGGSDSLGDEADDYSLEDSFHYCNVLLSILSPYNNLYRDHHSPYVRTMPHLLPEFRRRLLPHVSSLVAATLDKQWIGIGAFAGVLTASVQCGKQERFDLRLGERRGADEDPEHSRGHSTQGNDDEGDTDAQEDAPRGNDNLSPMMVAVSYKSARALLDLMKRLAECSPEELDVGTSNHELKHIGRLIHSGANFTGLPSFLLEVNVKSLSETDAKHEEELISLLMDAQGVWQSLVHQLLQTSNLKFRLFAASELGLIARDVFRLRSEFRSNFVKFVQSHRVLEQLLTNIDHRCLAKAESLFVKLAAKGQLPLNIIEGLWAATANNNAHTVTTIFSVLNAVLSEIEPATLVKFIKVVDKDLRGLWKPPPLQISRPGSPPNAGEAAVAPTVDEVLGKQKRITRLIQARIQNAQPLYADDPYDTVPPDVCDALLDLAWAPFDMLLQQRNPISIELVASQEGRKVLDRFPSFYERFLRSMDSRQTPTRSAARQHFLVCSRLLSLAADPGTSSALDPRSTALLCAFMERILRADERDIETWQVLFQHAVKPDPVEEADVAPNIEHRSPAGIVRRVFLGALSATARTVTDGDDNRTRALQEATTALLELLDTVAPAELLEEDGALARELWKGCLSEHPSLYACFFDWILSQPLSIRRHFSASMNAFMFDTLCGVPTDTVGLSTFACFRMFFLRINAKRLVRTTIPSRRKSYDDYNYRGTRLGAMRVVDRNLLGKEELFRLMVNGPSSVRSVAISFYCSLLFAMSFSDHNDEGEGSAMVREEFEETILDFVLREVRRAHPKPSATVSPEDQARLCRVVDFLREVLRCCAMPTALSSHDPGPRSKLADFAVKTRERVETDTRGDVDLYIPPMLFKSLGVRASDSLMAVQQKVLRVCDGYTEAIDAFERVRLVLLDPRRLTMKGRIVGRPNGSTGRGQSEGPPPTTSVTTPGKKRASLTAPSQSGAKTLAPNSRPLVDLHSSLWTLGLDAVHELHGRWEPKRSALGSANFAEDGLYDGRKDGQLIQDDLIWLLFVWDTKGIVPALLDVLEALSARRGAVDDPVALDARIRHVWNFLMWLPTATTIKEKFETASKLDSLNWAEEFKVGRHLFHSVYSLQALRNVLVSHSTAVPNQDPEEETRSREWCKAFIRSGCLAPTFRVFEQCDVDAMRTQCVIRSCLDVTLSILLFIFGGDDEDSDGNGDSAKPSRRELSPRNDSEAGKAVPTRIRFHGHIGVHSARVTGTYRLLDFKYQKGNLWKKEEPENSDIHIFYIPKQRIWMIGQLTYSGSKPDPCGEGLIHSLPLGEADGDSSPVGFRYNFYSQKLDWQVALQAKCEAVDDVDDSPTDSTASSTSPSGDVLLARRSTSKMRRQLSEETFQKATAAVDAPVLVSQLLEFIMELSDAGAGIAPSAPGAHADNIQEAAMLDKALALLQATIEVNGRARDSLQNALLQTSTVFSASAPLFFLLERSTHLHCSSAMSGRLRAFFSALSGQKAMQSPILEACIHILTTQLSLDNVDNENMTDSLSPRRGPKADKSTKRVRENDGITFFAVLKEYLVQDTARVAVPDSSTISAHNDITLSEFGVRILDVAVTKLSEHIARVQAKAATGTSQLILGQLFQLLTALLEPPKSTSSPVLGTPRKSRGAIAGAGTPAQENQRRLLETLVALTMDDCLFKVPSFHDRRRALCTSHLAQKSALETMFMLGSRSSTFLAPIVIKLPNIIDPAQQALAPDADDTRGDAGSFTRPWIVPVSNPNAQTTQLKSSTGSVAHIVGLKNQGNTCYMNSVLQQLFHVSGSLRDEILKLEGLAMSKKSPDSSSDEQGVAVAKLVTLEEDAAVPVASAVAEVAPASPPMPDKEEVLRQLQRTFTYLSEGTISYFDPVSFVDACRTFSTIENVYHQNDAGTFFSELFSRLETIVEEESKKAKENKVVSKCDSLANSLKWHFSGRVINENIRVSGFTTFTVSPPTAIFSVPIRGVKTLQEALEQMFCVEEQMTGDSQLWCDKSNCKVDAVRTSSFKVLPNLLAIQLKRFDFCMQTFQEIKVNSRLEFPFELDMFPYTQAARRLRDQKKKKEAEDAARAAASDKKDGQPFTPPGSPVGSKHDGAGDQNASVDANGGLGDCSYTLRGIVIQSGAAGGGHYYSLVKNGDAWFRINDQIVSSFDASRIPAECFGGRQEPTDAHECTHSAYILFYERNVPEDPPAPETEADDGHAESGSGAAKAASGTPKRSPLARGDSLSIDTSPPPKKNAGSRTIGNVFSEEVWRANTREERRWQLASPAVDEFLRKFISLGRDLPSGTASYFLCRFCEHFVCNVLRFSRQGKSGRGRSSKTVSLQTKRWLSALKSGFDAGSIAHHVVPLVFQDPVKAPLLSRCVHRVLLDSDFSMNSAREAVCQFLKVCVQDGEQLSAIAAQRAAQQLAATGASEAEQEKVATAPDARHTSVQLFEYLVTLMPLAQQLPLTLTKEHGFGSILPWVVTEASTLPHAPSFVAPPVLAIEALVGFLVGDEAEHDGEAPRVESPSKQDARLAGRLVSWPAMLANVYKKRTVNKKRDLRAVPMPRLLDAVENLMQHPDFDKYDELLQAGPTKGRSILSFSRLVDVLSRQVLSSRDIDDTNQDVVFRILTHVMVQQPDMTKGWGLRGLLTLHEKCLKAVDDAPTESAERCYVQVKICLCFFLVCKFGRA